MDCNFPEILARDLEASEATFTSKRMTAGVPLPTLAAADRPKPRMARPIGPGPAPIGPPAQYYQLLSAIRSLDAIEEWGSKIEEEARLDPLGGDVSKEEEEGQSSDPASEYSATMELPPSIRPRQRSTPHTAPASVASRRGSFTLSPGILPRKQPPMEQDKSGSWVNLDSDSDTGSDSDSNSDSDHESGHDDSNDPAGCYCCDDNKDMNEEPYPAAESSPPATPPLDPASPSCGHGSSVQDTEISTISGDEDGDLRKPFHSSVTGSPLERPSTSCGFRSQEKPRLEDVPQPIPLFSPRRWSSMHDFQRLPGVKALVDGSHSDPTVSSAGARGGTTDIPCQQSVDGEAKDASSPSTKTRVATCTSGRTIANTPVISLDQSSQKQQQKKLAPAAEIQGPGERRPREQEQKREERKRRERGQTPSTRSPAVPHQRDHTSSPAPPNALPKPPLGRVHNWLEATNGGVGLSPLVGKHIEHSTPGVPPPPEVIDTLRISIVCFPETMLLSSSLTIETIRNYSKKFKNHGTGGGRDTPDDEPIFSFPATAGDSRRRWKLPSLLTKRAASPSPSSLSLSPSRITRSRQTSAAPPLIPPPSRARADPTVADWSSLKNIFPTVSDYLCDALYAHLLAYNYITSLCKPGPPAGLGSGAASASEKSASQDSRAANKSPSPAKPRSGPIPKKAAHLLGLSGGAAFGGFGRAKSPASARRNRSGSSAATARDPSLRELQEGLGRCVARLVATLKLTTEPENGEDPSAVKEEVAGQTMDPLLLRCLCEVVRCSEEVR